MVMQATAVRVPTAKLYPPIENTARHKIKATIG